MTDLATIGFKADTRELRTAQRDLNSLAAQGGKTSGAMTVLTRSLVGLAAAAGGLTVISKTIGITRDFGQAVADLSAITGATGRDLDYFRQQAADIGRTTSLSAQQAATAFKLIASAQPQLLQNAEALNEVTRSAVTLSEATGETLPASAAALGSALNQFQLDASEADNVINLLAASAQLGTAEVGNVTAALRNAGPAAQALGVDLGETVAGIQALAAAGRQGSDAGTGLRQVLLRLERIGDQALQPSVVGLTDALAELESRNLSNTDLMQLFGDEAFAAATAILGQRDVVERLDRTLRGTNTAYDQASTRMDTLEGDSKELRSAIEGLSIAIGEAGLEAAARRGTQALTEFFRAITGFVEGDNIESLTIKIEALQEELDSGDASNESALEGRIERLGIKLQALQAQEGDISASLDLVSRLNEKLAEIENQDESFVGRVNAAMTGVDNQARADTIRRQIRDLEAGIFDSIVLFSDLEEAAGTAEEAVGDAGNSAGEASEKYRDLASSLSDELAMLEMSERQKFIYQQTSQLTKENTDDEREALMKLAGAVYDETQAQEAANKAKEDAAKRARDYTSAVENLRKQLDPAGAAQKELANQTYLLDAALMNGNITFGEYVDLLDEAQKQSESFGDRSKRDADAFETAWERGIERVDDIFADLWSSAFNGFEDFGSNLKRGFNNLLAEMAQAAVTRPIVLSITGGGGIAASGSAAASGGGAGAAGIGGSGVGIFDAIRMGFSSINTGIQATFQQGVASLGVGIYDFAPGIGESLISNAASISGFLSNAAPFAGAAMSLIQGDMERGIGQAVGAGIGTAIGGPIGGFIGSALGGVVGGLFGGDDLPRRGGGEGRAQFENGQLDSQMRSQAGRTYDRGIAEGGQQAAERFAGTVGSVLQAFGLDSNVTASAGYGGRPGGSGYGNFSANVAGRRQTFNRRYHDDFGEESLEAFLNRVVNTEVRRAIQRSDISSAFKSLFAEVSGNEEIIQLAQASARLRESQEQLSERFGITADEAAKVADATGLAGENLIQYVNNLASAAGQFQTAGGALVKIAGQLEEAYGGELPATLREFDNTLADIDTTTQAGIEAFRDLYEIRGGFEEYRKTIEGLTAGVQGAITPLLSETEQLEKRREKTRQLFEEFGADMPQSERDLIAIGESIDYTTEEGLNLAAAFPSLVDAFRETREQADQLTDSMDALDPSRFGNVVDFRRARALNQNGIPGFASGGTHTGGLRVVGERGPEVEATGPSRIFNQSQLIDMKPLLSEVGKLRADVQRMQANMQETSRNTRTSADILQRVSRDGESFQTQAAS